MEQPDRIVERSDDRRQPDDEPQRDDRHGDDRTSIVLTGFMGTGKSTVGRRLAARLGYGFVDTDDLIAERHGPIATIFATRGEAEFRRIEREVAAELATRSGLVVATGGRLMVDPENAELLGRAALVVCLTAAPETILARVTADESGVERPLLAGDATEVRDRIAVLLAERAGAYARFEQVDTEGRSPDEIVDAIVALRDR